MTNLRTHFSERGFSKLLFTYKVDIAFVSFVILLVLYYNYYISTIQAPVWDGTVYLANAKAWLERGPLVEIYRPPLISWIISGIWIVLGENWEIIKYVQAAFTVGAGIVLYITLREHKGSLFAFGVSSLTMVNAWVFFNSAQILTEGISLFFVTLTLYFLKTKKRPRPALAGISIALTFAARYPIVLQSFLILVVESIVQKNPKMFAKAIMTALPAIGVVTFIVFLKTGTFQAALPQDVNFGPSISPFYILNAIPIWGYAILLVPISLLFKRTYSDRYNYTFIIWFIVALLFWSTNSTNQQERFTIQFMPATYYLAILAIENILKSNLAINITRLRLGTPR